MDERESKRGRERQGEGENERASEIARESENGRESELSLKTIVNLANTFPHIRHIR